MTAMMNIFDDYKLVVVTPPDVRSAYRCIASLAGHSERATAYGPLGMASDSID
jgi:hypothetical protein